MADTNNVGVETRDQAEQIIESIRDGSARQSLHRGSSVEDPMINFEFTDDKPQALKRLMKIMEVDVDRVAHERREKYVLPRDGAISFVYLAKA